MDSDVEYVGAMAQDLLEMAPNAVCCHATDGMLRVDYSKIDVDFGVLE